MSCDLEAPGYTDVIRRPMDFSTIQSKLSSGQYDTADDVFADIRLIFTNCSVYYAQPTSPERLAGSKLSRYFERRLKERGLAPSTSKLAGGRGGKIRGSSW